MTARSDEYDGGGPWASSSFLPFSIPSRRSSITSLSPRPGLNRETLSQALDDIHTSASQTTNLVTFRDFAPPPPAPKDEERPSTQSGLGSLYARLRPSSRNSLDLVQSSPSASHRKRRSELESPTQPQPPSPAGFRTREPPTADVLPSPKHAKTSSRQNANPHVGQSELSEGPLGSETHHSLVKSAQKTPSLQQQRPTGNLGASDAVNPNADVNMRTEPRIDIPHQTDLASQSSPSLSKLKALQGELWKTRNDADDSNSTSHKGNPQGQKFDGADESSKSAYLQSITASAPAPPQLSNEVIRAQDILLATDSKGSIPVGSASDLAESHAEADISHSRPHAPTPVVAKPTHKLDTSMHTNSLIDEMRRKVLSRDFWMKDENAKACFNCGDPFTAFRRKHHCRTCGQIYDAKCTVLIPGHMFDQEGRLRICKTCQNIIVGDDSSEVSDDDQILPAPQGKSIRFSGFPTASSNSQSRNDDIEGGHIESAKLIPESRRRTVPSPFENTPPTLTRPGSSRSLKSISSRPRSASHRYRRSRHQHMKSLPQALHSSSFKDLAGHLTPTSGTAHAFHTEDVIDPDIAPFMSDKGSSDDEHQTIASALHSSVSGSHGTSGMLAKRPRPRPGSLRSLLDPSQHSLEIDHTSVRGSRPGTRRRQIARTMSMGSAMGLPTFSPRLVRSENLFTNGHGYFDFASSFITQEPSMALAHEAQVHHERATAPLLAELNRPSLEHFNTLLRQLLEDARLENAQSWEKTLVPVLLRCAEEIDPNLQRGDAIDIRHYVKLKKAPAGKIEDTSYVSGVVFSKNMALKGMRREIKSARVLLISFPLVYTRHQQHFISLDAVIAQEKEYLRNIARRIIALGPDVVLAQHQVAGFALELLKDANITVAYNVKESVLHAVSRCTETRLVSSVDKLTMDKRYLGSCERFEIKTMVFETYKKSYIFVAGCKKDLGCTVVLRGADQARLHRIKWITEFMCYVAYNLKLETSLIRDQFSSTPTFHSKVNDADGDGNGLLSKSQARFDENGASNSECSVEMNHLSNTMHTSAVKGDGHPLMADFHCEFARIHSELERRLLSISPSVALSEPYLLLKGLEQERHLKSLKTQYYALGSDASQPNVEVTNRSFELIKPEMIGSDTAAHSQSSLEKLKAIRNAELAKADHYYTSLRARWESFIAGSREPFSPLSHQQIVVLHDVVSLPSMNACEGPDLLYLAFYQEHSDVDEVEPDMPLGEYIEKTCEQAQQHCPTGRCDKKMIYHHRHYVHGDGQITIITEELPSKLRGLENTILMWSVCKECQQETPVVPMSRNTWKYSFAKYLELSFWSRTLAPRAGICPHDIHKCHTRYFGFNNLAVSVKYEQINIMEINVPRNIIFWKVDKDVGIKNNQFTQIEERLQRFTSSVIARIDSINLDSVKEEKIEKCRLELEGFKQRIQDEREFLMQKLQDKYQASQYYEIIPLNRAVRAIQEKVAGWDSTFADFEHQYFPSEKDIRRLATQQLRNAYLAGSDIAEMERADEKNELRLLQSLSEDRHSQYQLEEVSSIKSAQEARKDEPSVHLTNSLSPNELRANTHGTSEAKDIPVGRRASRMVDELDLAKSPESPIAKQKAAALDERRNTAIHDATEVFTEEDESNVSNVKNEDIVVSNYDAEEQKPSSWRRRGANISPLLVRSRTQPPPASRDNSPAGITASNLARVSALSPTMPSLIPISKGASPSTRTNMDITKTPTTAITTAIQAGKTNAQSMIPRSKRYRRAESRVSALAKHFEQMSREFERERLRERRQRAARVFQAQVYSTASLQPVVEVFKDADAAVSELENAGDIKYAPNFTSEALGNRGAEEGSRVESLNEKLSPTMKAHEDSPEDVRSEDSTINVGNTFSDNDTLASDAEPAGLTDSEENVRRIETGPGSTDDEMQLEFLDIPKHDKTSMMKMLTSFWSERSASGWAPLEYPLSHTDHIFADSDIIVREDEPSSLIAFILDSKDYLLKLGRLRERVKTQQLSAPTRPTAEDTDVERTLLGSTATHLKYSYQAGPSRMLCRVFYAESFDAIRQRCGVSERFVESLSRCVKWDSQGGKTKSLFLKTIDGRFVLKSLSQPEATAFLGGFAPNYFDYMSRCLFHGLPSALAKILGIYQVVIKNPTSGIDFSCFLQVMENVFYEGPSNKMFDLKGSMRNRKVQSTGEQNEVLLDENLLDYISQAPMYVRNHANSFLTSSISNDTLFLTKQNVMDYSLIVGLYDDRQELMVGVIDYIRTYTWDKKLEFWIKDRGKNKPTVRSPREYRNRFRASIARYFPLAPSCWQIFGGQRIEPPRGRWDSLIVTKGDDQPPNVN